MPPEKFTVGLIQMSMTSDPDKNLQHAIELIHDASGRGARVVCLPELFQTQYFCQREDASLFDLAEPIPGQTSEKLSRIAKELGIVLVSSLFEKRAPGLYHNTAAIFESDGALRGLYRKMHIPDDPLYYEKYYFTPGDLGYRALTPMPAVSARWCVGTSGIRRAHGLPRYKGRAFFFIRQLSARIPLRKPSSAPLSMMHGGPFSGHTPSPMVFM